MAKEWILNTTTNRFQLNYKKNVGAVVEAIRKCSPRNLEEWENYYFNNIKSKEHIKTLGKTLYIKITEVVQSEILEITEQDCINYMFQLVINRTFDGYETEIQTIYGQLESILKIKIYAAPDEWDRKFNIDFYIEINKKYIGLQIKPINNSQMPEIFKEKQIQLETHKKFTKQFGGKVFYIYSIKRKNKKEIYNTEVINEIKAEIYRLFNT